MAASARCARVGGTRCGGGTIARTSRFQEALMPTVAHDVLDAIGNTPLVELHKVVPPGAARVLAKLEFACDSGLHYLSTDVYRRA